MPWHLLSDRHVRTAKPKHNAYRLMDGDNLCLFVPPSGICSWQFRCNLHGKQQTATLGKLVDMALAEARTAAAAAQKGVANA